MINVFIHKRGRRMVYPRSQSIEHTQKDCSCKHGCMHLFQRLPEPEKMKDALRQQSTATNDEYFNSVLKNTHFFWRVSGPVCGDCSLRPVFQKWFCSLSDPVSGHTSIISKYCQIYCTLCKLSRHSCL